MAQGAPKGNQFWKLRTKIGRDKLFKTPEKMWEAACEYFEYCDENPLIAIEYNGKDAIRCELPKMQAYTLHGLCLFLGCNIHYFSEFETRLYTIKDEKTRKAFSEVITRIRETIYQHKFIGAASGFFNHNIIARDLGLIDKSEVTKNKFKVTRKD